MSGLPFAFESIVTLPAPGMREIWQMALVDETCKDHDEIHGADF